jgi:hypothetical protein
MTAIDLSPLANHLWQSTFFAGVVWLLTLMLKKNRAAVRYWLWIASSVKFLIPFSLLVSIGSLIEWRTAPPIRQSYWPKFLRPSFHRNSIRFRLFCSLCGSAALPSA